MAEITIPFREDMALAAISGRKICTTRSEKYGDPGDTFEIKLFSFKTKFVLTRVEKNTLWRVAQFYFYPEGVETTREFIDLWNEIHPRRGFRPEDVRWTHWFEMVKG